MTDPLDLLRKINDPDETAFERISSLQRLDVFLAEGGDVPVGPPGEEMHPTLSEEAVRFFSFDRSEWIEVALIVRARLAYGDR